MAGMTNLPYNLQLVKRGTMDRTKVLESEGRRPLGRPEHLDQELEVQQV